MGVTTDKKNKPFNPRGNDQSPKGFNRAKLFSGKALDFDGVNDKVNITTDSFDLYAVSFYFKGAIGTATNGTAFSSGTISVNDGVTIGGFTASLTNETIAIGKDGNYTATNETFADGVHFICASWDATNSKYKIYVNGQEVDTFNNGSDAALNTGITAPALGYRKLLSDQYIDGGLSNVRAFNTALTAEQVADLYNNPEKVVPTGVDNTALKLWLPMMEGAGTTAYNGAPDALGSELVTNGTFDTDSDWTKGTGWSIANGKATRSGASSNNYISQDFNVVSGTTYMLKYDRTYISGGGETNAYSYFEGSSSRVTRGQYTGTAQETVTVLDTFTPTHSGNLAFRFYGIGTFTGSIDNIEIKPISGIGTISGATWTHGIGAPVAQTSVIDWNKIQARTNGGTLGEPLIPQGLTSGRDLLGNLFENVRKQGALNLDGNSWAEVHKNDSIPEGDEGRTLECWFFAVDRTHTQSYMETGNNSGTNKRFAILTISSNIIYIAGQIYDINTGTLADLNAWNHVVVTHDGSTAKVYKNGSLIKTVTGRTYTTALDTVSIGRNLNNVIETSNGAIAQPRIYNRALTASEIQQNYNAGKNTYTN